jgi:phosphatidylserine decarboxylase
MAEEDADGEPTLQVEDNAQVDAEEEDDDEYPSPEEMETPDDPAVILARLREASRRHDD